MTELESEQEGVPYSLDLKSEVLATFNGSADLVTADYMLRTGEPQLPHFILARLEPNPEWEAIYRALREPGGTAGLLYRAQRNMRIQRLGNRVQQEVDAWNRERFSTRHR